MVTTQTGLNSDPCRPLHRAQEPTLRPLKVMPHFSSSFEFLHCRQPRQSQRALDEERGGVVLRSRVETITPQPTPTQRTGGSAQFPLVQTCETTLRVRRNFSLALSSLLRALLAQLWGSRRTLSCKLTLGAHWRRGPNSWPPKKLSTKRRGGISGPHRCRNFWLPSVHNPLLRPFSPRLHHF